MLLRYSKSRLFGKLRTCKDISHAESVLCFTVLTPFENNFISKPIIFNISNESVTISRSLTECIICQTIYYS